MINRKADWAPVGCSPGSLCYPSIWPWYGHAWPCAYALQCMIRMSQCSVNLTYCTYCDTDHQTTLDKTLSLHCIASITAIIQVKLSCLECCFVRARFYHNRLTTWSALSSWSSRSTQSSQRFEIPHTQSRDDKFTKMTADISKWPLKDSPFNASNSCRNATPFAGTPNASIARNAVSICSLRPTILLCLH